MYTAVYVCKRQVNTKGVTLSRISYAVNIKFFACPEYGKTWDRSDYCLYSVSGLRISH